MKKTVFVLVIFLAFFSSCVPLSKFNELKKKSEACAEENAKTKSNVENLEVSNKELNSKLELLNKENEKLINDSLSKFETIKLLQQDAKKMEQQYRDLQLAQENLTKGNAKETTRLLAQLQTATDDLQTREDELRKMEWSLNEKKKSLDEQNKKVKEMESILSRKDSVVNALKTKVSSALLGFENNGLTVKVQNGKVYVSLEDKLLFKSGSYEVNQSGEGALKKLAKVLEQNQDINVLIEGHTDNVPYRSEGVLKDNWDLSVKRATTVVRVLVQNTSIDPRRLTAAGRSQYVPIDKANTPDARQKNRRTEIILTPKLDELFKILESN